MSQQNILGRLSTLKVSATLAASVLADIAAGTEEFLYVMVALDTSGNVVIAPAAGTEAHILGILQNKPSHTGDACEIAILGTSKVLMSEACDEGEFIVPADAADGTGEVADATLELGCGIALEAATADGDIIEVFLNIGASAGASVAD